MHSSKNAPLQLNLDDKNYSHCCIEKYGTAKKWMRDDFNLKEINSSRISVFNKVQLDRLGSIPFGRLKPNDKTDRERFTLFIDGKFYKMDKFTVSSKQLKHGDLIHYIITPEQQFSLKKELVFDDILNSLSNREKEVLTYFAQGHSMTRIAKLLFLSPHTIDSHRMNLCKKLKVKRTTELAVWAQKLGLLNQNIAKPKTL